MFWVITVPFNTVSLAKAGIQTIPGSNIYKNKKNLHKSTGKIRLRSSETTFCKTYLFTVFINDYMNTVLLVDREKKKYSCIPGYKQDIRVILYTRLDFT